jgi:hypothetical protein
VWSGHCPLSFGCKTSAKWFKSAREHTFRVVHPDPKKVYILDHRHSIWRVPSNCAPSSATADREMESFKTPNDPVHPSLRFRQPKTGQTSRVWRLGRALGRCGTSRQFPAASESVEESVPFLFEPLPCGCSGSPVLIGLAAICVIAYMDLYKNIDHAGRNSNMETRKRDTRPRFQKKGKAQFLCGRSTGPQKFFGYIKKIVNLGARLPRLTPRWQTHRISTRAIRSTHRAT